VKSCFPMCIRVPLVLAVLVGAIGPHRTTVAEPMVVVSATSIETLLADINYISELAGVTDAGRMATMMARPYTAGLDKTRPVGIAWSPQFQPLVLLPVDDLQTTFGVLKEQFGEPRDAGNGVLELQVGAFPIFIKEQNKWAFVSQTMEGLQDLPADPTTLLEKLPNQYDLAIRAFVQRVPKQYRDMAMEQMKHGAGESMRRRDGESDESYAGRQKMVEEQLRQMTVLFNEADEITFGTRIDRKNDLCQLDFLFTALPDTNLARQCTSLSKTSTHFQGLVKDTPAFQMLFASVISPDDIEQATLSWESMRQVVMSEIDRSSDIPNAEARALARQLATEFLDVPLETIKTGRMDAAVSLKLVPKNVNLAVAAYISNPAKLEETLKKVVHGLEKYSEFPPLKLDVLKHADVRFHRLSIPIPAHEERDRRIFGSTLDLTFGFGKDAVYVSIGEQGLAQVKQVIDQCKAPPQPLKRPVEISFRLAEVLSFAAEFEDNPAIKAAASAAREVAGQDTVRFFLEPINHGVGYRTEIEQGVIRIIGKTLATAKSEPRN